MLIEIQQQEDFCILRLGGRFASGAELEYLEEKLDEIRSLAPSKVLADFREVTSIGSTGLGFVVRVFQAVTNRPSGRFVIAGLTPRLRETFEITRLASLIPLAADLDTGKRALLS
jgi:anti-anti-sigma factor